MNPEQATKKKCTYQNKNQNNIAYSTKNSHRLKVTEPRKPFDEVDADDSSSDDEFANETEEERGKANSRMICFSYLQRIQMVIIIFLNCIERRLEFEHRRKKHYNEFEAIKLARKLIEEDEEEDEGGDGEGTSKATNDTDAACSSGSHEQSTSHSNQITDDSNS